MHAFSTLHRPPFTTYQVGHVVRKTKCFQRRRTIDTHNRTQYYRYKLAYMAPMGCVSRRYDSPNEYTNSSTRMSTSLRGQAVEHGGSMLLRCFIIDLEMYVPCRMLGRGHIVSLFTKQGGCSLSRTDQRGHQLCSGTLRRSSVVD